LAVPFRTRKRKGSFIQSRRGQQLDKYNADKPINRQKRSKGETTLNESKWRHTLIKGFRISPALFKIVQSECQARRTNFSDFVRYAIVGTMKRGRYQAAAE
jgi:hypothetical protein